jgi:hypothetical protein
MGSGGAWLTVAVLVLVGIVALRRSQLDPWKLFEKWFRKQPPAPAQEILPPDPEPEPAPPNYGNVRPVPREQNDLVEFGPEVHEFPEYREPATRFEDFNRRLFIHHVSEKGGAAALPETTVDDFPTKITGISDEKLAQLVVSKLRPRYPVIYDPFGWWANASALLELDPDYADEVVRAYLALPEAVRPVVISRQPGLDNGYLQVYRYGFAKLHLPLFAFRYHLEGCLNYLLATLIRTRSDWLWFSIARMRQEVVRGARSREEAEREQASKVQKLMQSELEEARRGSGNRWRAIFATKVELPALAPAQVRDDKDLDQSV